MKLFELFFGVCCLFFVFMLISFWRKDLLCMFFVLCCVCFFGVFVAVYVQGLV